MRPLLTFIRKARGRVDISKLTTNGVWGSQRRCGATFDWLVAAGWLDSRLFVPLLMVSIGEQNTPLEHVCRIIHHAASKYTDRDLNIAVSSLANPATREHKIYPLMECYERMYGDFPHDRVHSTMRVYLDNDRLDDQAEVHRPGHTPVARWMDRCYDCFAPTVGAYMLPTALMKQCGDIYACAAFNVPEQLNFGNLLRERARDVLSRVNRSDYVAVVRADGGLKALHDVVPRSFTESTTCDSYCGSCALLIQQFDARSGRPPTGHPSVPLIDSKAVCTPALHHRSWPPPGAQMSSSDTTGTTLETAVVEAARLVTGHDLAGRLEGGLRLEDDLGVDGLALVELVEILQDRLDIVVPDEVTGQLRTIADLVAAMARLITPGANVAVLPQQHREGPR